METLKTIVQGTKAILSHVCEGKVFYIIQIASHLYQLEINSCSDDWKATYLMPEFKAIQLMRWIRKGLENDDGSFLLLK
ncbi:MAG: hypothetical protein JXB17_08475 [Bacteroidales bacterium]|nr:hypothetical protein [Bacteroidales bacterium]